MTFAATAYLIATHILHDGTSYTGYGRYQTTFASHDDALLITRHAVTAHVTKGSSAPAHAAQVNQLQRTVSPPADESPAAGA